MKVFSANRKREAEMIVSRCAALLAMKGEGATTPKLARHFKCSESCVKGHVGDRTALPKYKTREAGLFLLLKTQDSLVTFTDNLARFGSKRSSMSSISAPTLWRGCR
jgi:hypothetical protein